MSGSKSLSSYDYACIRVVPRVEHEEFINAGVILFCRTQRFLGATVWLDEDRVRALCPQIDLDEVRQQLEVILAMCKGAGPVAAAGIADTVSYRLLNHQPRLWRVNGSNLIAAAVDSLCFPLIAFGWPMLWGVVLGQLIAKVVGGAIWAWLLFSIPRVTSRA